MTTHKIDTATNVLAPIGDGSAPNAFLEHLRTPALSLGTYTIPAGGHDDQTPHREDEIYVVLRGSGTLTVDGDDIPVRPGSAVLVPARSPHSFTMVDNDLTLLVFFAPAYSGR